jgi:hypothetical protein
MSDGAEAESDAEEDADADGVAVAAPDAESDAVAGGDEDEGAGAGTDAGAAAVPTADCASVRPQATTATMSQPAKRARMKPRPLDYQSHVGRAQNPTTDAPPGAGGGWARPPPSARVEPAER